MVFKTINNMTVLYNPEYDYFKRIFLGDNQVGTRIERSPADLKKVVDNMNFIFKNNSIPVDYTLYNYEFSDSTEVVIIHVYPNVLYEYHIDAWWVKSLIEELQG